MLLILLASLFQMIGQSFSELLAFRSSYAGGYIMYDSVLVNSLDSRHLQRRSQHDSGFIGGTCEVGLLQKCTGEPNLVIALVLANVL